MLPVSEKNKGSEVPVFEVNLENAQIEEILLDSSCLREVIMHHLFSKHGLFNNHFVYRRKFDSKNYEELKQRMRIANEMTFS